MTTIALCEFCRDPLATVNLEELTLPLKPEMFKSINEARGIPAPFHPDLEWKHFKCPICKLRPQQEEHLLHIVKEMGGIGIFEIGEGPEKFICECGKEYAHDSSLERHKRGCNG